MFKKISIKGFTFVELLVVLAIIGIIATISAATFKNMYTTSTLKAGGSEVYRAFTNARSNTLASQDGMVYGVHLSTSTVTQFSGSTYVVGSSTNKVYTFEGGVTATSSLIADSPTIIFTRLTGNPSAQGTIYLRNSDGTSTTTIVVYTSGLIEYR
jgi:prepilin-type N-terminal cleavage/methylation domain-containing protein